ncbi:UvrABC system protein C [subsurface metagenome]
MSKVGVESIPLASLAKENEEIFVPQKPEPIILPHSSSGLQLLQRLRDEAHRFAISYYQKIHKRETFTSSLDAIPGIGPKRKRALLRKFGSVQGIREASEEEIAAVTGISKNAAKKLKGYL